MNHGHRAVEAQVDHDFIGGDRSRRGQLNSVVINLLQADILPLALAGSILGTVENGDGVAAEVRCTRVEQLGVTQHLVAVNDRVSVQGVAVFPGQALAQGDLPHSLGVIHLLRDIGGKLGEVGELIIITYVGTIKVNGQHVGGITVTRHRVHVTVQGRNVSVDGDAQRAFTFGQWGIAAGIRFVGGRRFRGLVGIVRSVRFRRGQIWFFALAARKHAQC